MEDANIELGGKTFVAAPLTFKSLRALGPKIATLSAGTAGFDQIGIISEIVFASLARNAPDLTMDFLEEHLDTKNGKEIMRKVLIASGITEDEAPGETKPIA